MKKPSTLTKGGVLLIGGDSGLQQSVRAALEAENYEVLSTASPDPAQDFPEAGSIDILVLEADHEAESLGRWLAQMKAQRPQLRTIGIRGSQNGAARGDLAGVNVWLEKTPSPAHLVATVNALLAELRSEILRERLLRRQAAPLLSSGPHRHWGLNE
jgi:DNA-binding response OmpR family regulator